MFDKSVIESLQNLKDRKKEKYVSIFNDGTKTEDDGTYVLKKYEDMINDVCSPIDSFLTRTVETLSITDIDYDKLDVKFRVGLIYKKETLGDNDEILPSSELVNDRVRYYTDNVYVYNNNKLVKTLKIEKMINAQGVINYNKFVNKLRNEGLSFTGPNNFEELKEFILSNNKEDYYIVINFAKKIEEVKEIEQPKEVKTKKRSLFRR